MHMILLATASPVSAHTGPIFIFVVCPARHAFEVGIGELRIWLRGQHNMQLAGHVLMNHDLHASRDLNALGGGNCRRILG